MWGAFKAHVVSLLQKLKYKPVLELDARFLEHLIGYLSMMNMYAMSSLKENGTLDEICVEQEIQKETGKLYIIHSLLPYGHILLFMHCFNIMT